MAIVSLRCCGFKEAYIGSLVEIFPINSYITIVEKHVEKIVKMPGKNCIMLYLLKRAAIRQSDLVTVYLSVIIVGCLSVLSVHFCKKSQKLEQMTFDGYLSNPDIGRTFWGGLTASN